MFYIITNDKLTNNYIHYLYRTIQAEDTIIHLNTFVNFNILRNLSCVHSIFLNNNNKDLIGFSEFILYESSFTSVFLEKKSFSLDHIQYDLNRLKDKIEIMPDGPPNDNRSAEHKMFEHLSSLKKDVTLINDSFRLDENSLTLNESIVNLRDLNWFFLTSKSRNIRKTHIYDTFSEFVLFEVHYNSPFNKLSKFQTGAIGFLRMIETALALQDRTKPFKPFVLLEDDVSKSEHFRYDISYPSDCDLLYVGVSLCVLKQHNVLKDDCFVYKLSDEIYKVSHMLSTHGVIVCSAQGATMFSRCLMEAFFRNTGYDIHLSCLQGTMNVYALNKPIVYQDKNFNGHEKETNIVLDDVCKNKNEKKFPVIICPKTNINVLISYT